ncbi:sulfatase-like hydrolase/transferase [Aeoliella mucimassa]|uniref:Arylsulfatase n=1 Tax=Aeoliella mucimassa TaxID=2527972 RepID=A0A518APM1_9BACT|nr:sulfatase-like hydrolase/transferase [Aeoliella mucimassa]QDU56673.1 Arylsulfatase [Aeoliella mucimassa]
MNLLGLSRIVKCGVLLLTVLLAGVCSGDEHVNLIYILADDLGYGDLGCYGQQKIQTPHLDRMAAEGLTFTRHYAGGPVCGPSRACLMTGQSQSIGYIKGNPGGNWRRENLRDEDITIAEKIREAGYQTACFGKWGLGPQRKSGYPTRQGFDRFVGYDTHVAAHNYYPKTLCEDEGKMQLAPGQYSHDVFANLALEYVARDHNQPYFLYLAYTIPHAPYNPPDLGPYADKTSWPNHAREYAAMITRMDSDIGKLLDVLRTTGRASNTLVIFSGDNGPQSNYEKGPNTMTKFFDSNGPLRGIKRDVFEGGVRVPMIAWQPGVVSPGRSDHVSGFQDIMPTYCELAGVDPPAASMVFPLCQHSMARQNGRNLTIFSTGNSSTCSATVRGLHGKACWMSPTTSRPFAKGAQAHLHSMS